MSDLIAGACTVSAAGGRLALVGEFTYRPSSVTREAKMGSDGFHGRKEKPMIGMIKAKVRNLASTSIQALNDMVDADVVAELANGKTVIGSGMFRSGEPLTADAEEAEIEITWEGDVSEA